MSRLKVWLHHCMGLTIVGTMGLSIGFVGAWGMYALEIEYAPLALAAVICLTMVFVAAQVWLFRVAMRYERLRGEFR